MIHRNSSEFKPRYESKPYRQSPGRREAIHGPIHGLNDMPSMPKRVRVALAILMLVGVIVAVVKGLVVSIG